GGRLPPVRRPRRRAGARGRAGSRLPGLARPPVGDRASRVVPAPPGRDHQDRREPPEALRRHRELRLPRPRTDDALAAPPRGGPDTLRGGTIRPAETPPKRHEDIVNFDFLGPGRTTLWPALLEVVLFWVELGVRIFRVDNPHTKPLPFWEWLLREARERDPG